MCHISQNIKFCTCKNDSVEKLKHYWVLHKYIAGQLLEVMGEMILPLRIDKDIDSYNRKLLLRAVNDLASWDVQLQVSDGDRLELNFQLGKLPEERMVYGFEFDRGKWRNCHFDAFKWMQRHTTEKTGEIWPAIDLKE